LLPALAAGLTAFLVLKPMTTWLLRAGWTTQPFTAQENTVVQTFAMAMVTSLWILGFGSYLQAMDQQTYVNIGGASTPGNYAADVSNPCGSFPFFSFQRRTCQPAFCGAGPARVSVAPSQMLCLAREPRSQL